jgi:ABC-type transporter Mla MlaB component
MPDVRVVSNDNTNDNPDDANDNDLTDLTDLTGSAAPPGLSGPTGQADPAQSAYHSFDAERLEIQTGSMRVAATFEPPMLSIDGDIDVSVLPALVGTLAKVAHHGRGDVRIDLARLRRVDVGGLRALVASAGNLNRDGRRLVLHAVAPWLLGLLIVTGWDDAPGLRLLPGPVPTG